MISCVWDFKKLAAYQILDTIKNNSNSSTFDKQLFEGIHWQ